MELLDIENIILFHKKIVSKTGGSEGIRDLGLIESALNRALMTFDGKELYESPEMKIYVIAYGLISNHGFVDGNKRIGIAVMILLLKMNAIMITYIQQELIVLGLAVAEGKFKEKDILEWIERHK
ncbi:type II toxin-antitoxin system death-on-curing family toxin [Clostridium omnivorum]|uniref:Death-on-curing protein n=1 Tax=Clostridium omnivorum TaxID=1604902 RepID=A0ABQ5N560_9CLOT|nr:type II toxin-antitoxin system death-on-curing family toxin [Clostridium sp. E14]GLC30190.1 death-on-curing protein [Clostridium sp. E14]